MYINALLALNHRIIPITWISKQTVFLVFTNIRLFLADFCTPLIATVRLFRPQLLNIYSSITGDSEILISIYAFFFKM